MIEVWKVIIVWVAVIVATTIGEIIEWRAKTNSR